MIKKEKWVLIFVAIMSILGVALSFHLLQIDYGVKFDDTYTAGCDINAKISCTRVAQSKYAYIWEIPLASFGLMGYFLTLIYIVINKNKKHIISNLLLIFSLFSLVNLYYFYIANFILNAICIYCYSVYIVGWFTTLVLLVYILMNKNYKFSIKNIFKFKPFEIILYIIITVLVLISSKVIFHEEDNKSLVNGSFDSTNLHGIISPKNKQKKPLEMVVYSDYECPFCYRFENSLKKVLKNFVNLKLIRKEFPLDKNCNPLLKRDMHVDACNAAYYAKCAGLKDKFWEMAKILHDNRASLDKDSLKKYSKELKLNNIEECTNSKKIKDAVLKDILEGTKLGVRGTPAFTINGKLYSGAYGYIELKKLLEDNGGIYKKEKK